MSDDIPLDVELEAPFDAHEAITKRERPPMPRRPGFDLVSFLAGIAVGALGAGLGVWLGS